MYVSPEEAAKYLSMSPWTLLRWRQIGVGPKYSRLLGRSIRYRKSDLDQWMRENCIDTEDQQTTEQPRLRLRE